MAQAMAESNGRTTRHLSIAGNENYNRRWQALNVMATLVMVVIFARLWQLQIINHDIYIGLASGQQELYRQLFPKRGSIYASERSDSGDIKQVSLAINRRAYLVYADTRSVVDPSRTASLLADVLGMTTEELLPILTKPDDPYEPIKSRVSEDVGERIKSLGLAGIELQEITERFYPNNNIGSHILGFVNYQDNVLVGQYGVEGSFNKILSGTAGELRSERDARGVWIPMADSEFIPAKDGADVVLTVDWPIQFNACRALDEWVNQHGADGGSLIVIEPKTGAILAMCGSPDFNPNTFNEIKSLNIFNNPATFLEYEPGSIMKAVTMAAAIDQQKIKPDTTYNDTGEVKFGTNTIRNSDNKSYGLQTMVEVLEKSLNTGAIYAMRQLDPTVFKKYFDDFGFGRLTGLELKGEAVGDLSNLSEKNEIYRATASFGQGIAVTPLQMVNAYAALANGGKLMEPFLIKEINYPDGRREKREPRVVRQVVSERTATVIGGMLVSVVERGHGKRGGVNGYYIAGKTGTAEIPLKDGRGYEQGVNIGSFVGFGPVDDPRFAMIVRVDRPRDVKFAESSAAPLFGKVAKFILQYYEVPPRNDINQKN
ncbi:hypothetical protein A3H10_05190 [Candidatus Uhrbacteria bacterium RIFCSPLOWO2_12_FULL_46_10]|uniref:Penicillin-binding protein transpeptidase domain-containing protein n=1 Tax=Candidatus Uhrbacteria bacterium RIFCSPLOWO2_01_FULL_47_25 TaxID=1802402 RepID=A0A1F7UT66_9BACT|nr:MAG: Peptidoglycan glycosyltransferase [Parcubacteria group bacterium GW2011_GWA2_46_9]OGL68300.1 MAG: hypothetical protein A3D60_05360 [Candidatus Uhrbacteria bacterium RIFCSPHIGHO2_02_FULL_47_29]OGL75212.1 MAG: hypothetical protein A3E96_03070 [Candidatus Uhrbacteria bacterium RIFCSPHIGHO2_12_FULL_46_13]OGL81455.1 MAG: hypothetical protein A2936_00020 [Candidatus Uhrbacteria bacterium RIFCSPLOWO2_01_FULL_47_25]OGL85124.1 MAG: hypothetical protein A3I37_04820 [Candidatus Uhrbacteria bacteri